MQREQAQDVVRVGKSLSDPTRVLIMASLAKGPRAVGALSVELKVPRPMVSYHMALLHMAGVVQRLRKGKQVFYTVNREKLESARAFLAKLT